MYEPLKEYSEPLTFRDIIGAIEKLRDFPPRTGPLKYFTGGSGIPDKYAIDYYKDTDIIVVDRNFQEWQYGKPLKGE